jgi:hypothetical protein
MRRRQEGSGAAGYLGSKEKNDDAPDEFFRSCWSQLILRSTKEVGPTTVLPLFTDVEWRSARESLRPSLD